MRSFLKVNHVTNKSNLQGLQHVTWGVLSFIFASFCNAAEPVVVNGTVADEQTKQEVIAKLKSIYGESVVDQIKVANVKTPPQWRQTVLSSIHPDLKNISKGKLDINGTNISLTGKVDSQNTKTLLTQQMMQGKPTIYKVQPQIEISASEQKVIDQALGDRIVEFESGSAILTATGQKILDEMALALNKVGNKSVRIIGHTDSQGNATTNLGLSLQRANAVREYLVSKGVNKSILSTNGLGSTQPIADNETEEGRRRNRRIEFEVI